jgi:hypothetical protein
LAAHYIAKLKEGGAVQFRPRGGSMKGRVDSGHVIYDGGDSVNVPMT